MNGEQAEVGQLDGVCAKEFGRCGLADPREQARYVAMSFASVPQDVFEHVIGAKVNAAEFHRGLRKSRIFA
ncbi:hypothetical protein LAUMK40_05828 [Mycobacterium kansasii]|uniref:hypothetical protein n=1 Tax=Mycobacterium kansasii TaxID=1768 RepID=UPI000F02E1F3|nr:hypothetical protein [Mycobacterium kansasii]VAZ69665.1 hypothetical protein LAUMK40_05828 [Mycobacterium kansasii]